MARRRTTVGVAVLAILVVATTAAVLPPRGSRSIRSFDADRIAGLELSMWQAYYAKQPVQLFGLLMTTLREQYHHSWAAASQTAFHLARAASTFGDATGEYEVVLPDLVRAYEMVKEHTGATFQPSEVARAELAWWVARRTPGQNSPEQVGGLIAREYAELYDAPLADMIRPGLLRAQAAAQRDAEAARPDWPAIGRLLNESYRELQTRLGPQRAAAQD